MVDSCFASDEISNLEIIILKLQLKNTPLAGQHNILSDEWGILLCFHCKNLKQMGICFIRPFYPRLH
jgi:hypothetical protein